VRQHGGAGTHRLHQRWIRPAHLMIMGVKGRMKAQRRDGRLVVDRTGEHHLIARRKSPLPPFAKGGMIGQGHKRFPPLAKGGEGGFNQSYRSNTTSFTPRGLRAKAATISMMESSGSGRAVVDQERRPNINCRAAPNINSVFVTR